MKTVKFLFLFIFLIIFIYPQEGMKSKKAISFSFDGFNLGEFNGGIGGKIWLSDKSALVTSIDLDFSDTEYDGGAVLVERDDTAFSGGLKFGLERHFKANKKISPYIGALLGINYNQRERKRQDTTYTSKSTDSAVVPSLRLVLGVEYFITKNISLSGQHNLGFSYYLGEQKVYRKYSDDIDGMIDEKQDYTRMQVGFGTSSLVLSIYF